MSMGSIFHDTVASVRRPNEIKTSLVVMAILAGVHHCVGMTASPHLTSYPEAATDGADFTLYCTPTQGWTLISVRWYRNNVNIFDTSSDADISDDIRNPNTSSPEYQSVSGRISVSSSLQQHNVTLRTNSTLDQGSVWRCKAGPQFSNKLTVELKASFKGPSSTDDKDMMTTVPVDPAVSSKYGIIFPITDVAGSIIVVIVVVVAIATSVLLVRKYKQDVAESNDQMYSTMSRDPNTDNDYTELDHGHAGVKFPTSLSVNTEESPAYYNTAPADSQYENPPASTE